MASSFESEIIKCCGKTLKGKKCSLYVSSNPLHNNRLCSKHQTQAEILETPTELIKCVEDDIYPRTITMDKKYRSIFDIKESIKYLKNCEKLFFGEVFIGVDELLAELPNLRNVYFPWEFNEDLRFITNNKNLTHITLSGFFRDDITPLYELPNLEYLDISDSDYGKDNSQFRGLTNIKQLIMSDSGNAFDEDLSFVENLPKLENLSIGISIQNIDITPLLQLQNLKELSLSITKQETINILAQILTLEKINFRIINPELSFEPFTNLTNLKSLSFYDTPNDTSFIKNIPNLKILKITNSAGKLDISFVNDFEQLEEIIISKELENQVKPREGLKITFT